MLYCDLAHDGEEWKSVGSFYTGNPGKSLHTRDDIFFINSLIDALQEERKWADKGCDIAWGSENYR